MLPSFAPVVLFWKCQPYYLAENLQSARCSPFVISKALAARTRKMITARARKNKRTARMLANARKDHSIPLTVARSRFSYQSISALSRITNPMANSVDKYFILCNQPGYSRFILWLILLSLTWTVEKTKSSEIVTLQRGILLSSKIQY